MKRLAVRLGSVPDALVRARSLRLQRVATALGAAATAVHLGGCLPFGPINKDAFPVTTDDGRAELRRMRDEPVDLERPVVILSGYHDVGVGAFQLGQRLVAATSDDPDDFLLLAYPELVTEVALVARVVNAVEERWPSGDPARTVEVDVVGHSMGGIVARAAALPPETDEAGDVTRKRLAVVRLFTLATPHRGASLARFVAVDPIASDMRPGSDLLARLDRHLATDPYELVPYAKLNDGVVGATNAAPPGRDPIWVRGTFMMSHFNINEDPRVIADLARRLRNEEPLGEPSEPPRN